MTALLDTPTATATSSSLEEMIAHIAEWERSAFYLTGPQTRKVLDAIRTLRDAAEL